MERIETVIIGGGQAGLATSFYLTQSGREHVVLERATRAASAWREGRWDSFTLVTPNWTLMMPGAEYDGPDREGFMPREQIVAYFERYAERFQLPVRFNSEVRSVEPIEGGGFRVSSTQGIIRTDNVVVATGYEQFPKLPPFASNLAPDILQLHSSAYRNPASLPEGAVLVVGSAQSGAQIAEELHQAGRRVFLATGRAGRAPRRYRGRDTFEWLYLLGFFDITPDKLPIPADDFVPPHLSGTNGGHTLNLHQFARDGVTLLGHLRGADGNRISVAPDLHENLARADGFEREVQTMIDGFIQASGHDAPTEDLPQDRAGFDQPIIDEINLKQANITSVIWATGYGFNYSFAKVPVFDQKGFPCQSHGVTNHAGLYFVGLPWMPSLKTGTLVGAGESARHVVSAIADAYALRA